MTQPKEQERLGRLRRRLNHLLERIADPKRRESARAWDRSEASALQWAIRLCELALSNWPQGIAAVKDQEDRTT